jgi:hypothetical protein
MQTFFTGLEGLTYHGQPLNGEILFRRDQVKTTPQHISNYKYQPVHTSTIKWGVDIASQLVFLVDRTGNAIPRKTTRLRSWVKSIRHAGHRLYILKDPTSKQLAALVRRLHLKPDQIVGIGSLPDVVIVRSPRKTGDTSNVQGVYDLVTLDPIATMADEFLWVEIPRVTGRDWSAVGGEVARYNDAVSVRSDLCQAWRLTGSELPVYALTPSAVKRVKPSPANNLLKVVKAHVLSERRTVARKVKVRAAVDHLRSAGRRLSYQLLSDEIVNRMLVRLVPDAVEFSQTDYGSPLEHLFKNLDSETYTKAVAAGIEHATKVADRYPLLFDTTEDDILRYVNSNPRKRKGSNAQEAQ